VWKWRVAAIGVRESHDVVGTELTPLDSKSRSVLPDHLACERRSVPVHDPSRTPAESKAHPDLREQRDRQGGGNKGAANAKVDDEAGTDQAVGGTNTDRKRYLEAFTPSMLHELLPLGGVAVVRGVITVLADERR